MLYFVLFLINLKATIYTFKLVRSAKDEGEKDKGGIFPPK